MLTGRSHSGAAQVRCLALSARHCDGETLRVARPTSTTTEPALRTRCRVPSRWTVLLEIGIPPCSSDAGAPSSPFRPSMVVLMLMCGRTPLRLGSVPAPMAWCMASTKASARRCLAVLRSSAPSGLDMESMAALSVVPPTGSSQASSRYMPPLSLMKSWRRSKSSSTLAEKPSGSTACHVPAAMSRRSLMEKRLALPIHISSSREASADLINALLQMADDRGRLESDLTRAHRLCHYRHRAELAADAQPIGRGGLGHLAFPCHP